MQSLIEHRQSSFRADRINGNRIHELFPNDPEYAKLFGIAEDGVIIDLPEDFLPATDPPPMGKLHSDLVNTFREQAYKNGAKQKLSFFLCTPSAQR